MKPKDLTLQDLCAFNSKLVNEIKNRLTSLVKLS